MRTCVVSGATGGIGVAVVGALLERGDRVLAIGRSAEKLAALDDGSGRLEPVVLDLAAGLPVHAGLGGLTRLDALIHCAGIAEVASVEESDQDLWQRTMSVNVLAAAELTRVLLPALRAGRGGVVFVNLAPRMGVVSRWSAYVASKAALSQLADALRQEEHRNGVRVTTVYPGGTATDLLETVRAEFGACYDPADCIEPSTLAAYILLAVDAPPDAYLTDLSVGSIPAALRDR